MAGRDRLEELTYSENLVWIDLEMTGLDPEVERIIENLEAMVDAYEHREVREAIDDLRKLVDDFQDPPRGNQ